MVLRTYLLYKECITQPRFNRGAPVKEDGFPKSTVTHRSDQRALLNWRQRGHSLLLPSSRTHPTSASNPHLRSVDTQILVGDLWRQVTSPWLRRQLFDSITTDQSQMK